MIHARERTLRIHYLLEIFPMFTQVRRKYFQNDIKAKKNHDQLPSIIPERVKKHRP